MASSSGTGHDAAAATPDHADLRDWREASMPSHEEMTRLHGSADPLDKARFELWRGASIVSSVTAARLSREQADALLLHIACLEEDSEAERQQDKERIERLTEALAERATVADEIAAECDSHTLVQFHSGRASAFREIAAALAVEEDATP